MVKSLCYAGLICFVVARIGSAQHLDLTNPRVEAEYLSLEISGELRPPVALADQIQDDLAAIRLARPDLANIHVFPSWIPGDLTVGFTPAAFSEFEAGTFSGFDSLYAELGTPQSRTLDSLKVAFLNFNQMYHGVRLAQLFQPVDGVRYAEPNFALGDGNDIIARANRPYPLSRGHGDCPAGCIYRESWDFTVTEAGVFSGTIAPPPPGPGDFNSDGAVDAADYVVWRKGAGSRFNAMHHIEWRTHFDATSGAGSAALGAAAVPEPAGAILILLGFANLWMRRARVALYTNLERK
ncbi:MAG TPA: hypothetical protein VJ828_17145 [Lacipirellulaceae bacterium]|nr:hypothetical protein [Lacipirellulaceae bacterium]